MSARRLDILWEPWDGRGIEHLRLSVDGEHAYAESELLDEQGEEPVRVRYRVRTDAAWRTRSVEITLLEARPRLLRLHHDGDGHWRDGAGGALPELDGCLDVDLECSPFTNTLPIRRLGLAEGGSADVRAAWVRHPALTVQVLDQRYTRVAESLYRYEALSGFRVDLEVDADGVVLDYGEYWRRVEPHGR